MRDPCESAGRAARAWRSARGVSSGKGSLARGRARRDRRARGPARKSRSGTPRSARFAAHGGGGPRSRPDHLAGRPRVPARDFPCPELASLGSLFGVPEDWRTRRPTRVVALQSSARGLRIRSTTPFRRCAVPGVGVAPVLPARVTVRSQPVGKPVRIRGTTLFRWCDVPLLGGGQTRRVPARVPAYAHGVPAFGDSRRLHSPGVVKAHPRRWTALAAHRGSFDQALQPAGRDSPWFASKTLGTPR